MPPARARVRAALLAGLAGLGDACGAPDEADLCLPPALGEPAAYEVTAPTYETEIQWWCEAPPPDELLDGSHWFRTVWVPGPCDPCDRERIAAFAASQVCTNDPPPRLLCGPVARELQPWDREGCVYAIASSSDCPIE